MKSKGASGEFAKYVSQNVFAMIGMSCYILADTFFISKAVGANGITALNLVLPLYNLINTTFLTLCFLQRFSV